MAWRLIHLPRRATGCGTAAWTGTLVFCICFIWIYYFGDDTETSYVYVPNHVYWSNCTCKYEDRKRTESMCYRAGDLVGRPFDCELAAWLQKFRITSRDDYPRAKFTSEDITYVMYSSANHFNEFKKAVAALRKMTNNTIVFYDLGLREHEVQELKGAVCNLEYRKFQFQLYPDFVHTLFHYHFKPIIQAELFASHKAFWMVDTSLRFWENHTAYDQFLDDVRVGKFETYIQRSTTGHNISFATNRGMLFYLPARNETLKADMMDSTAFVVQSNESRDVVKWNFLCAMTKACMAPARAKLGCRFSRPDGNCHRFDQSASNILIANELLEKTGTINRSGEAVFGKIYILMRGDREKNEMPQANCTTQ